MIDIAKTFGNQRVLDGVSLTVEPGRVTCLAGANGAGKTTLIRIALGILRPDAGSVRRGEALVRDLGRTFYRSVGAVLDTSNTYGYLSGWSNLEYLGALSGLSPRSVRLAAASYIERLDLGGHMDKLAGDYSTGMRQKLAMVAALLTKPSFVVLDEPTLGLDVMSKLQVLDFIRSAAQDDGTAVLLTSHQSDVVKAAADTLAILVGGKIQYIGTVESLLEQAREDDLELSLLRAFGGDTRD